MKRILTILALLLIATTATAGGLWNEITVPIAGVVQQWDRSPLLTIENGYNTPTGARLTAVMERAILYPDGMVQQLFLRRNSADFNSYAGKEIDMIHPESGTKLGTFYVEELAVLLYSLTYRMEQDRIATELQAQNAATLSYTTNGSTPIYP